MDAFARLLDRLAYTPARTGKLRLMSDYFREVPDPDRGFALAALTDGLAFKFPVRRLIQGLMARRVDVELYRLSRDYVGDTAETAALIWPEPAHALTPLRLGDVVAELALIAPDQLEARLESWLDGLDATGRLALLKLLTGAPRVGASARLAKTAVAALREGATVDDVEAVWHALAPPYGALFDWIEGRAPKPETTGAPVFRPLMLAHSLDDEDWSRLDLGAFAVEWKWDGIRVQASGALGSLRLYSRTGEDIGPSFPELLAGLAIDGVLDGELLIVRDGLVRPFNDLQQRLNRKSVTRRLLAEYPAHIRFYDALEIAGVDLRARPFIERRRRLEDWHGEARRPLTDLSQLLAPVSKPDLEAIRAGARDAGIEGLMLKRRDSPYLAGRPKGHWYKWKRAPLTADCVLMYAQRGSGRRSSLYSDYTFGVWRAGAGGGPELVPVGKAYSGFTDAELVRLDRFVRENTIDRFGPVRSVVQSLVFEIAFDGVQRSPRHKSGVAFRFPRIARIRWDKPVAEADTLQQLLDLIKD